MWLLILAIVLLLFSSLLSAYYASWARIERPVIFLGSEILLPGGWIASFLTGAIMLFIAAGWKWGLAGLAIYWLLVNFVLMPIAHRVLTGRFPGLRG